MKEGIHKLKDERVILRFDEGETDWKRNKKSEYRTGSQRKSGLANAKRYWTEADAAGALVKLRILSRKSTGI